MQEFKNLNIQIITIMAAIFTLKKHLHHPYLSFENIDLNQLQKVFTLITTPLHFITSFFFLSLKRINTTDFDAHFLYHIPAYS